MILWLRDIIWLSQILSLRNVLLCLSCLFYVHVRFRIVWLTSCKLAVCWILFLFKNWVLFSVVFWVFSFFIKKY